MSFQFWCGYDRNDRTDWLDNRISQIKRSRRLSQIRSAA
jgi:hypothetical protein